MGIPPGVLRVLMFVMRQRPSREGKHSTKRPVISVFVGRHGSSSPELGSLALVLEHRTRVEQIPRHLLTAAFIWREVFSCP